MNHRLGMLHLLISSENDSLKAVLVPPEPGTVLATESKVNTDIARNRGCPGCAPRLASTDKPAC